VRALTGSEIIGLWESVYCFHPIDRVLAILQVVMPEQGRDALADLPLGRRDGLLLAVRRSTFGDSLAGKSHCPHCGEAMEFILSCSALCADTKEPQHKTVRSDGYELKVRPLNSFDLAAAAGEASLQEAKDQLMQRCVVETRYQGATMNPLDLPEEIIAGISETALAVDPQAEILLDLNCSGCGKHSKRLLDIGHILWLEISTKAKRLLMEVHLLARAYGWAEKDILQLSVARRSAYLQMAAI
jgi:hypothetical protein